MAAKKAKRPELRLVQPLRPKAPPPPASPPSPSPNALIVNHLKMLLERAEKGELTSLAVIADYDRFYVVGNLADLLLGLEVVKHHIVATSTGTVTTEY